MSGRAAFHNPHTLVRTPYFQCSLVFFADRLFVTPLWLPGIDHFPVQVTVSPLSTLSRRLRGKGKEISIPTRQLVSSALVRPLSGKLSDFYFNRSFAGRD